MYIFFFIVKWINKTLQLELILYQFEFQNRDDGLICKLLVIIKDILDSIFFSLFEITSRIMTESQQKW